MTRLFRVLLMSLGALLVPASTSAGTRSGTIVYELVHGLNVFMFQTANYTNVPSCSTAQAFAISLNSEAGRLMAAQIISAHAQGKSVTVIGSGVCSDWPDRERPSYVVIY